jgi:hypothetical protein
MGFCGFEVGLDKPLFSIAEPCVIAPESLTLEPLRPLLDTLKLIDQGVKSRGLCEQSAT